MTFQRPFATEAGLWYAEVIIGSAPRGITEKASYISPILEDVFKYLQNLQAVF